MSQENDRRDIEVLPGGGSVAVLSGRAISGWDDSIEIAPMIAHSNWVDTGFGIAVGQPISVIIPLTASWRLSAHARFQKAVGEGILLGIGFCLGAAAYANLFAFDRVHIQPSSVQQHIEAGCYTEIRLDEGDTLTIVSFSDVPGSFVSGSEPALVSIAPIL